MPKVVAMLIKNSLSRRGGHAALISGDTAMATASVTQEPVHLIVNTSQTLFLAHQIVRNLFVADV